MEIVTWVLGWRTGAQGLRRPYRHYLPGPGAADECWYRNLAFGDEPEQRQGRSFCPMWVVPDAERLDPGYGQLDINTQLNCRRLVPIASGRALDAAVAIRQRGAVLWGGRLKPGEIVPVPDAPFVHVYIAKGTVALEGAGRLSAGDAVRLTGAGGPRITADEKTGAEVLIWEGAEEVCRCKAVRWKRALHLYRMPYT